MPSLLKRAMDRGMREAVTSTNLSFLPFLYDSRLSSSVSREAVENDICPSTPIDNATSAITSALATGSKALLAGKEELSPGIIF